MWLDPCRAFYPWRLMLLKPQEFFRVARARLSPETFTAFLASIKALNAHTRTRAQTLEDAQILFGQHNMDLYTQFESLLAAHLA